MLTAIKFYDTLPKRKIELYNGKIYVGGSLEKTAMTMAFIIKAYGAGYVAEQVSSEFIQDALIEVYKDKNIENKPLADFNEVESGFPYQHLASNILQGLFGESKSFQVWGRGFVMKLGSNMWAPDVFVYRNDRHHLIQDYYFDGPADLVIEVPVPYMKTFDENQRMENYAKGGVRELWLVDKDKKNVRFFHLHGNVYKEFIPQQDEYTSHALPEITVKLEALFSGKQHLKEAFSIAQKQVVKTESKRENRSNIIWGSLSYNPLFDLEPVAVSFEQFVAWGGETKFEFLDGKPIFGGSERTTKEYLGLFMMTLGIKEVIKYLPEEEWLKVL